MKIYDKNHFLIIKFFSYEMHKEIVKHYWQNSLLAVNDPSITDLRRN
jgi:hypothetical protein